MRCGDGGATRDPFSSPFPVYSAVGVCGEVQMIHPGCQGSTAKNNNAEGKEGKLCEGVTEFLGEPSAAQCTTPTCGKAAQPFLSFSLSISFSCEVSATGTDTASSTALHHATVLSKTLEVERPDLRHVIWCFALHLQ